MLPSRKHDWLVGWDRGFSFPVSIFSRIQKCRVFIRKQLLFKSSSVKDRSPCVLRGQFSFSEAKELRSSTAWFVGVGLSLCFGHLPSLTHKERTKCVWLQTQLWREAWEQGSWQLEAERHRETLWDFSSSEVYSVPALLYLEAGCHCTPPDNVWDLLSMEW